MYVCVCACAHECVNIHLLVSLHACMHAYECVCACMGAFICACVCLHECISVCACACLCVGLHIYGNQGVSFSITPYPITFHLNF